jgi:hypothetical protein
MKRLSDDELIGLINSSNGYTEEALAFAEKELVQRGGLHKVKDRIERRNKREIAKKTKLCAICSQNKVTEDYPFTQISGYKGTVPICKSCIDHYRSRGRKRIIWTVLGMLAFAAVTLLFFIFLRQEWLGGLAILVVISSSLGSLVMLFLHFIPNGILSDWNIGCRLAAQASARERTITVFDFTGKSGSVERKSKMLSGKKPLPNAPTQSISPNNNADESLRLRLADSNHPAHEQLEQVVKIIDEYLEVDNTLLKLSAPSQKMGEVFSLLQQAISICPADSDLVVAKACLSYMSAQFKSSEELIDVALRQDPNHFEAKMWKSHWDTWHNPLRFPKWNEEMATLHPIMSSNLQNDLRAQIVRDGLQKSVAIVADVQGPSFDKETRIKISWVFSETPYGSLIAYYPQIIEPVGEPSTMEAFLPIFQPSAFSPMEGFYLIQQLAFLPYCFVVLVNGNTVVLNRKIIFSPKAAENISNISIKISSMKTFLAQDDFKRAMQWHMEHFDMKKLEFD